ncbi:hypothetical protein B0H14DRAFT_2574830 [Mycena olivaceomarginata]|nr:hypothetical protein B0H14DRAFT_2574830 [Mycena olivaceomarginata]
MYDFVLLKISMEICSQWPMNIYSYCKSHLNEISVDKNATRVLEQLQFAISASRYVDLSGFGLKIMSISGCASFDSAFPPATLTVNPSTRSFKLKDYRKSLRKLRPLKPCLLQLLCNAKAHHCCLNLLSEWAVKEIIEGLERNGFGEDVNDKFTLTGTPLNGVLGAGGMSGYERVCVCIPNPGVLPNPAHTTHSARSHIPNRPGWSTVHIPQGAGACADHPQPGRQATEPLIRCAHTVDGWVHPSSHRARGSNGVHTMVTARWDIDHTQQRIGCWQYATGGFFRRILVRKLRGTEQLSR